MTGLYMDNNATTPLRPAAATAYARRNGTAGQPVIGAWVWKIGAVDR